MASLAILIYFQRSAQKFLRPFSLLPALIKFFTKFWYSSRARKDKLVRAVIEPMTSVEFEPLDCHAACKPETRYKTLAEKLDTGRQKQRLLPNHFISFQ